MSGNCLQHADGARLLRCLAWRIGPRCVFDEALPDAINSAGLGITLPVSPQLIALMKWPRADAVGRQDGRVDCLGEPAGVCAIASMKPCGGWDSQCPLFEYRG
jgi:hypothetical protein